MGYSLVKYPPKKLLCLFYLFSFSLSLLFIFFPLRLFSFNSLALSTFLSYFLFPVLISLQSVNSPFPNPFITAPFHSQQPIENRNKKDDGARKSWQCDKFRQLQFKKCQGTASQFTFRKIHNSKKKTIKIFFQSSVNKFEKKLGKIEKWCEFLD